MAHAWSKDNPVRALALKDSHGETSPQEARYLREEVPEEWRDALAAVLSDLDSQFASRKAHREKKRQETKDRGEEGRQDWLDYDREYGYWRARANKMKRAVETALMEAKRYVREKRQEERKSRDRDDRERYRKALYTLREFLLADENVAPAAWEERDELIEDLDSVLWPDSSAGPDFRKWKNGEELEEAS